jgi:hypothetical protein
MKLKRNEFTTSFVVIALFTITAALQLMSAYGAVCITWDPFYRNPPMSMAMFPYVEANLLIFQISNIITWLGVFAWGYIIYATLTQKKGAYLMALITSFISFVMGLVPALIADIAGIPTEEDVAECLAEWLPGMDECVEGFTIGSPHWARTFANGLVILVLILPHVRKSVQKFASAENRFTGNVAQQIMLMSIFFFWLSLTSFLGTNFMASAHVVQGINVWELVEIQSIGAYTTLIAGVSMLGGGFILKQFKPSRALITTVEVNK